MYKELLLFIDSCESESMFDSVTAPNILMMSTSRRDENAYSHSFSDELNNFLADKFTFHFHNLLKNEPQKLKTLTMKDFPIIFPYKTLESHLAFKNTFEDRQLQDFHLWHYFPVSKEEVVGNRDSVIYMNYADMDENLL